MAADAEPGLLHTLADWGRELVAAIVLGLSSAIAWVAAKVYHTHSIVTLLDDEHKEFHRRFKRPVYEVMEGVQDALDEHDEQLALINRKLDRHLEQIEGDITWIRDKLG